MFIAKIKKRVVLREKRFLFSQKIHLLLKKIERIDKQIIEIDQYKKKVIYDLREQRDKAYRRRVRYKRDIVQNAILDVYPPEEKIEALTLAIQSDYWNYTQRYRIARYAKGENNAD